MTRHGHGTPHETRCTVCTHPKRSEIDLAIATGLSKLEIARSFGVSESSVYGHGDRHLTPAIAKAAHNNAVLSAERIVSRLDEIDRVTRKLITDAIATGDIRAATSAVTELRGQLKFIAELAGKLQPEGTTVVNVLASPEWMGALSVILDALTEYPEARLAVATSIAELEQSSD